ncbi:MAG TPA: hypothetical protein PLW12_08335 [Methanothrix sp.]|nr:hypothetical protein [Methanothrix sp.]
MERMPDVETFVPEDLVACSWRISTLMERVIAGRDALVSLEKELLEELLRFVKLALRECACERSEH